LVKGRPKIELDRIELIRLYLLYGSWRAVSKALGVSKSTVYLRVKELRMKKKYYFE